MDEPVSRILALIKSNGMNQRTFASKLDIRPQAITEWKTGVTQSYTSRLIQISELLGTTPDFILYGEKKEPPSDTESGLPDWIFLYRSLDDAAQKEVAAFVEFKAAQRPDIKLVARGGRTIAPIKNTASVAEIDAIANAHQVEADAENERY